MSDPKHTPGPWHVGCLGSDSTCQCSYVLSEWYMGAICTVHVDNGLPIGEGGNDAPARDQAIANMHLIAAAPIMFDYIARNAALGDRVAMEIMEKINA